MRPLLLVAAMAGATLLIAPPAPASAGGGTPGPLRSGGAAYGSKLIAARPVARRLTLAPREITAGDAAPAIRLRVGQRGVTRVRARIVVLRLPSNRPVARVKLGVLKTDRTLTVRLPAGVKLRTGRYLVRLHVKDPRGRTLKRTGSFPGRARIVVRRPKPARVAPVPAPVTPAPAPSPAGPGAFPVAGAFDFGGPDARIGARRAGHIHEGQDIMAAAGTPVVAPYAGTISQTDFQEGGAGEYVVLDGADGRDFFFAHCLRGSTVVAKSAVVAAGQPLCRVGATGATSGAPHLHFEIWVVGWRVKGGTPIDPLPELRAWAGV
jgi:murein DD-endopeptidase MepM/ murein hydrolase activator NlpD